ncbi:Plasmodium vivax Vir protein, putative [Plasmodium ovale]|uniref:Plasmodium vivax Vir protein, putative n=1 Tax=Plasmodium ovale TaxID=36330 RepID=A0A1C3KJU9_PLAOA|nr:Plasmodium vivax Vir protein, putative [Plasmodium ovale]
MRESPYSFVGSYDVYKSELHKVTDDHVFSVSECENISTKYLEGDKNKCMQIVQYLIYLDSYSEKYISEGCKYLDYWLYDESHQKHKHKKVTLKFYESLNDSYGDSIFRQNICDGSIIDINERIFENIEKLIELYEKFNKFKNNEAPLTGEGCINAKDCVSSYTLQAKKCRETDDNDFCTELEKFRNIYNTRMKNVTSCADLLTFLPSAKNTNLVIILIPIIVILVIPFISFILYKWLRTRIRREKGMLNNAYPEYLDVQYNSERTNTYAEDKMYNIEYHPSQNP